MLYNSEHKIGKNHTKGDLNPCKEKNRLELHFFFKGYDLQHCQHTMVLILDSNSEHVARA